MNSNLVGMSFSWKQGTGYYVPVCGPEGSQRPAVRARARRRSSRSWKTRTIEKVGHNIKYDLLVMRKAGVNVRGIELDSMVGRVPARRQPDAVRHRPAGAGPAAVPKVPTVDLIGKGKNQITMDQVELPKIACYAAEDADIALRLADCSSRSWTSFPRSAS